ncbi:MAG TPA: hypothetical protein VMF09_16240 [Solirubrobacteraceae bacterium]|nr:hypothetical protein [Solirubrobacteraceae bacterium]
MKRRPSATIPAVALSALVLAAMLAGCGSSGSPSPSSSSTSATTAAASPPSTAAGAAGVSTRSFAGLGEALVSSKGQTLYVFIPDAHAKVTCVAACAQVWPPLKLASGRAASAGGQAKSSLLGSDPDPEGGRVVTYAGWPLYTYTADSVPGEAAGQAIEADGGLWYVIAPDGKPITKMR